MSRNDPYAWSRQELAAYKAHEVHRLDGGDVPLEVTEGNLRAAGMSEKNIRSVMQSVTDNRKRKQ